MADMTVAYSASHGLGEEQSIWYKLTPLLNQENPMQVLMALSEKYSGVVPINLKNHRIVLLSEPAHAERVLVSNADNYTKYFDGLRPVFGRSMITIDGALWQKIRTPQQPAFHPNMFEVYFPYLMSAIDSKMARWAKFASTGETIEMVEETWTLAAEMVCKALFDREMPFNPHFVFGQVKTYTDVVNHKSIRLKNVRGQIDEITAEDAAKAMEVWGSIPDTVIGANVNLAARLCSAAKRMEILITKDTLDEPFVKERIIYEEMPAVVFKGFDKPVNVYRVQGIKK